MVISLPLKPRNRGKKQTLFTPVATKHLADKQNEDYRICITSLAHGIDPSLHTDYLRVLSSLGIPRSQTFVDGSESFLSFVRGGIKELSSAGLLSIKVNNNIPCACGELNSRDVKKCINCSRVLPAGNIHPQLVLMFEGGLKQLSKAECEPWWLQKEWRGFASQLPKTYICNRAQTNGAAVLVDGHRFFLQPSFVWSFLPTYLAKREDDITIVFVNKVLFRAFICKYISHLIDPEGVVRLRTIPTLHFLKSEEEDIVDLLFIKYDDICERFQKAMWSKRQQLHI